MAVDFSKYGSPIGEEPQTGDVFSKYGTPIAQTTVEQPVTPPKKDFLQKATDVATSIPIVGGIGKTIGESVGNALYSASQVPKAITEPGAYKSPGSPQNIPKTIGAYTQAFGLIGGLGAAPTSLGGILSTGAATGATQLGGQALSESNPDLTIPDVTRSIKGAAVGAVSGAATAGFVYGIGKLISGIGDKITTSVIKPTKSDIADGFDINTIKQYNLGGSLNQSLTKTQAKLSSLSDQLSSKLQSTNTQVDLAKVAHDTVVELTDASKLKGFGANTKIANALDQLRGEVNLVAENGVLSVPDAQVVKQAAGNFGAWQFGKIDPDSKAQEIVYSTFYSKLKTAIEKSSPEGVRGINKELSKLIPIQNAILRRLPVADRAGLVSLNDMIGLVGSTMNPAALGFTILNLISKSGVAGNLLSKAGGAVSRNAVPAVIGAINGQQALPK